MTWISVFMWVLLLSVISDICIISVIYITGTYTIILNLKCDWFHHSEISEVWHLIRLVSPLLS